MIRDIRATDNPEVVVARGQLYDLDKVLDIAENLILVFTGTVSRTHAGAEAEIACRNQGYWEPFTEMEFMRMRTGFTLLKADRRGYDAGSFEYVIRVGPFKITVGLLGRHGLYRKPDGTLETIDGHPAETYDPAPEIVISARWHPAGLLEKEDAALARSITDRYLSEGLEYGGPAPPEFPAPPALFLHFSREAFGAGEGDVRIDVTDTE